MHWLNFLENPDFQDKLAVNDLLKKEKYTYRELRVQVSAWVEFFEEKDLAEGQLVALYAENSFEHLSLLFACAIKKLIFLPLNFRLSVGELRDIIDEAKPNLIVSNLGRKLDRGEILLSEVHLGSAPLVKGIELGPFDTALILFTSGTSGKPKGVMFHNQMLLRNQIDTCTEWELKASDSCLVETPFFHTGAYNVLCLPVLSLGGQVTITEGFNVNQFYSEDPDIAPSVYFGVPTMFQSLKEDLRFNSFSFDKLRFVISGGAYCPEPLIKSFQEKNVLFKQGFGLTEVGPNCFLLKDTDATRKIGSIGKPMGASQVKLLAKDNSYIKEPNEVGELLIKGDHLTKGFYQNQERFLESLFDGYYCTGDLAYFDSEGFYFIAGRKKDMYISGGENVYPAEVEGRLIEHPEIEEAVVVAVPHDKWGEVGFAFLRESRELNLAEVREFLNPILSRYKHPQFLKGIDEFPLLANGKIDKLKLKDMALELRG